MAMRSVLPGCHAQAPESFLQRVSRSTLERIVRQASKRAQAAAQARAKSWTLGAAAAARAKRESDTLLIRALTPDAASQRHAARVLGTTKPIRVRAVPRTKRSKPPGIMDTSGSADGLFRLFTPTYGAELFPRGSQPISVGNLGSNYFQAGATAGSGTMSLIGNSRASSVDGEGATYSDGAWVSYFFGPMTTDGRMGSVAADLRTLCSMSFAAHDQSSASTFCRMAAEMFAYDGNRVGALDPVTHLLIPDDPTPPFAPFGIPSLFAYGPTHSIWDMSSGSDRQLSGMDYWSPRINFRTAPGLVYELRVLIDGGVSTSHSVWLGISVGASATTFSANASLHSIAIDER